MLKPSGLLARLGILPALRYLLAPMSALPLLVEKRDSPSLRTSLAPTAELLKATCFSCGEVRHFSSLYLKSRKSPRINKIKHEYIKALVNDKATNEDNAVILEN